MGTPTRPTSPCASGWSESRPFWVGRSSATEKPRWPWASSERIRRLVSVALATPEYWPMTQRRSRYMPGHDAAGERRLAREARAGSR